MKSLNARLRSLGKWVSLPVVPLFIVAGYAYYRWDESAADFNLDNWDGRAVNLEILKGKVVLLTFSYSFCSVWCPIVTARLSALDSAVKASQDVVYLHVSVEPEMDTPERRRKHFKL